MAMLIPLAVPCRIRLSRDPGLPLIVYLHQQLPFPRGSKPRQTSASLGNFTGVRPESPTPYSAPLDSACRPRRMAVFLRRVSRLSCVQAGDTPSLPGVPSANFQSGPRLHLYLVFFFSCRPLSTPPPLTGRRSGRHRCTGSLAMSQ